MRECLKWLLFLIRVDGRQGLLLCAVHEPIQGEGAVRRQSGRRGLCQYLNGGEESGTGKDTPLVLLLCEGLDVCVLSGPPCLQATA